MGRSSTRDEDNDFLTRPVLGAHSKDLWKTAARKLSALDYATDLGDVSSPGNNLEKLKGALSGKYSIRVNDQFRIVFNFDRGEATNVVIAD